MSEKQCEKDSSTDEKSKGDDKCSEQNQKGASADGCKINLEQYGQAFQNIMKKSQKSIKCHKIAKALIMVLFLLLVAVSFKFMTKDESLAFGGFVFGGFGLAGIITILITNSPTSISKTTRQLFQIQISYFSYLKQLEIIDKIKTEADKSKRLEEVTKSLQRTLCKYFDSPPNDEE